MPARLAGACGLLAFVTAMVGWVAGGFAQPAAYSVARDDISDLGAVTAASPWLYNQLGANLTGLLVLVCALGLWRSVGPSLLGRISVPAFWPSQAQVASWTASSGSTAAGSTPPARTTPGTRMRTRSSRASRARPCCSRLSSAPSPFGSCRIGTAPGCRAF